MKTPMENQKKKREQAYIRLSAWLLKQIDEQRKISRGKFIEEILVTKGGFTYSETDP